MYTAHDLTKIRNEHKKDYNIFAYKYIILNSAHDVFSPFLKLEIKISRCDVIGKHFLESLPSAVREAIVSRHKGGPIKGLSYTP